ncbi:MAG: hypothetical protein AB202_00690 [Parcubacteria bacterium C7867-007]|nr:MAG: hypothetical protein AB202_00690 [Parcubacteria bacterium C7867-007]
MDKNVLIFEPDRNLAAQYLQTQAQDPAVSIVSMVHTIEDARALLAFVPPYSHMVIQGKVYVREAGLPLLRETK